MVTLLPNEWIERRKRYTNLPTFTFIILILCGFSACSHDRAALHREATRHANKGHLTEVTLPTSLGPLLTYQRITAPGKPVRVYIEGDGYAWITREKPSYDPTPHHPLMITLASLDPSENVLYIARPCQYLASSSCTNNALWTSARYSKEVVDVFLEILAEKGNPPVELVGYSGGAALALLIAERYPAVMNIRTLAGNLDTERFSLWHHVSPLTRSLMVTIAPTLHIPQHHFVGANDPIIPEALAKEMTLSAKNSACVTLTVLRDVSHEKGWEERWLSLLTYPMPCTSKTNTHP